MPADRLSKDVNGSSTLQVRDKWEAAFTSRNSSWELVSDWAEGSGRYAMSLQYAALACIVRDGSSGIGRKSLSMLWMLLFAESQECYGPSADDFLAAVFRPSTLHA